MVKVCKRCGQEKDLSSFYQFYNKWVDKKYTSARCKPCHLQHRVDNPNTPRNNKSYKLFLRYGITFEQWGQMREKENFSCMICGVSEEKTGRKLAVDHCHKTGRVRGVLCSLCNTTLGHAKDSVTTLEAAIKYLKDTKGGYKMKKPQQDLKKWTEQNWKTSDGTPSNGKKRYLPEAAWKSLTPSEKAATNSAKAKGNAQGKQFVKQPKAVAKKTSTHRK